MKLGIINIRCKRKICFFDLFRKKFSKYQLNGFDILETELIVTLKNKDKKLLKLRKKIEKETDIIFISGDTEQENKENERDMKSFFFELSMTLYKKYVSLENIKPYRQRFLIVDENLDAITKTKAENMCFWLLECDFHTQNIKKAESVLEYVRENLGATFKICDNISQNNNYDIVIDLDKYYLKIGKNILINKFDFGFSEISEKHNIPQILIASKLYKCGINPYFVKQSGREVKFSY